ncbi:MAG: AAA family ATPase [Thermaerobacter sp.]|jgi:Flp pilus assembly CpaE family ATPase|nr:AAA family ATPase [Thermaerobacter sp.]
MTLRILLAVANSPAEAQAWREWLSEAVPGTELDEVYAADEVAAKAPGASVVLLGQGLSGLVPLEQVIHELRQHTDARVVLLTAELGDLAREPVSPAMRRARELAAYAVSNAVFDVVPATAAGVDEELLRLRLERPASWEEAKHLRAAAVVPVASPGAAQPRVKVVEKREVVERERVVERTRVETRFLDRVILAFWNHKGGSGKTTGAVNTAVGLARVLPPDVPVALLDFNLGNPAVAAHMGISLDHDGIGKLVYRDPDESNLLDEMMVRQYGVDVLVGCPQSLRMKFLNRLSQMDADRVLTDILNRAQAAYPVVVVDTAPGLPEPGTYAAVRAASHIFLVVDQSRGGLIETIGALEHLKRLDIPHEKLHLILNKYSLNAGDDREKIEDAMNLRARAVVVSDVKRYLDAEHHGRPVALSNGEEWLQAVRGAVPGLNLKLERVGAKRGLRGLFGLLGRR